MHRFELTMQCFSLLGMIEFRRWHNKRLEFHSSSSLVLITERFRISCRSSETITNTLKFESVTYLVFHQFLGMLPFLFTWLLEKSVMSKSKSNILKNHNTCMKIENKRLLTLRGLSAQRCRGRSKRTRHDRRRNYCIRHCEWNNVDEITEIDLIKFLIEGI